MPQGFGPEPGPYQLQDMLNALWRAIDQQALILACTVHEQWSTAIGPLQACIPEVCWGCIHKYGEAACIACYFKVMLTWSRIWMHA